MTVVDLIRRNAAAHAARPAVIEPARATTHAELWERVDRLSQALLGLGLGKGAVLFAWLGQTREAIEAELASLQCGFIWVSLNARLAWPEAQLAIKTCAPGAAIIAADLAERIPAGALREALGPNAAVILAGGAASAASIAAARGYEELLAASPALRPQIAISEEDIARLRHTSGTTGRAKAAVLPHRVYLASLENLEAALHPLGPEDRALHAAPLTHASGALVFPLLAAGGANILLERFDAEETLAAIERERATAMFAVPTMLRRLAHAPGWMARDLSSMKTVLYGGAPTPPAQLAPLVERLGPALVHIFGMTEAPYPIALLGREEHYAGCPRLGSIGKPAKICKLRIVDEAGDDAPDGAVGELLVSGRNVMSGYWKDEAETARALRGGWLATGDLARRDADGFYWIVDRKKDVIISGGFNVYASEVELALASHPAVAEAAVAGAPDEDLGEIVAAYVVPRPGAAPDAAELAAHCRARLAAYKCPRRFVFLAELPKNASGKIMKKALGEAT